MMPLQGGLSVERMRELAPVSRAGFYRWLQEAESVEEEMEVRSVIQQIAIEHRRRYGYRRISAELRRRGKAVNHKRVARIMREDNLLAVQPRQFVVTTKSDHKLEVYLNLAQRIKLTGVDQLWVADITYIRLKTEFLYLAVILDGFSRKVVGWSLERTLASCLAVAALQEAIVTRKPPPGLVHHSDRGVQYASEEYVAVLEKQGMIPSMSRFLPRSPSPLSMRVGEVEFIEWTDLVPRLVPTVCLQALNALPTSLRFATARRRSARRPARHLGPTTPGFSAAANHGR